jgi:3-oxoacyl-[acyl-carrier protein] reductase
MGGYAPAFAGQVAVVTGITRGIGRATAMKLIAQGAAVAGIYVSNDEAAMSLREAAESIGGRVRLYKGSVDDPAFVRSMMEDVYTTFGRIDVLVNNAGRTQDQMALLMTEEQWDAVIAANVKGVIHASQAAIPYMARQRSGSIVNVTSVSGLYGREAQTNYAASKGALIGLTKLFARLHAADGIRVCAVAPGMIDTDMLTGLSESKLEDFLQHTLVKRLGTAEEVADAILYLADGRSAYATGQVLKLDGGFLR